MINCVNTETKTAIFGYGGIKVDVSIYRLGLYGIRPPVGAGTQILDSNGEKIGDWEYTGEHFIICFGTYEEANRMFRYLDNVEKNQGGVFQYDGITFDFTWYRQASMDVVKKAMRFIIGNFLQVMAC